MIPVIAPNYQLFQRFVKDQLDRLSDPRVGETLDELRFTYISRPDQLLSFRGDLVIVNSDQLSDSQLRLYAEYHDSKRFSVKWVDLS